MPNIRSIERRSKDYILKYALVSLILIAGCSEQSKHPEAVQGCTAAGTNRLSPTYKVVSVSHHLSDTMSFNDAYFGPIIRGYEDTMKIESDRFLQSLYDPVTQTFRKLEGIEKYKAIKAAEGSMQYFQHRAFDEKRYVHAKMSKYLEEFNKNDTVSADSKEKVNDIFESFNGNQDLAPYPVESVFLSITLINSFNDRSELRVACDIDVNERLVRIVFDTSAPLSGTPLPLGEDLQELRKLYADKSSSQPIVPHNIEINP